METIYIIYTIAKLICFISLSIYAIIRIFEGSVRIYHNKYISERQQRQYELMQAALKVMADQIKETKYQQEYTERILNATKTKHYLINTKLKDLNKITEEVKNFESGTTSKSKRRR